MTEPLGIDAPPSWSWMPLKHAVTYLSRGTSPDYIDSGGVRVIGQAANQAGGLDWSRTRFHRHDGSPRALKGFLTPDDILINSTGTGTLGRIGYFSGGPELAPCIADGHITIARSNSRYVLPKYLYYWLAASLFQDYAKSSLIVGATNQIELNRERLAAAPVLVPPLKEQLNLVSSLDRDSQHIDDISTLRRGQLALLVERKQALITAAVTGQIDVSPTGGGAL